MIKRDEIPTLDTAQSRHRCWVVVMRAKDKPDCFVGVVPFYETQKQATARAKAMLQQDFVRDVMIQSVDIELENAAKDDEL